MWYLKFLVPLPPLRLSGAPCPAAACWLIVVVFLLSWWCFNIPTYNQLCWEDTNFTVLSTWHFIARLLVKSEPPAHLHLLLLSSLCAGCWLNLSENSGYSYWSVCHAPQILIIPNNMVILLSTDQQCFLFVVFCCVFFLSTMCLLFLMCPHSLLPYTE